MTPPLDVIGDIANPTLTEDTPTETVTWSGVSDWLAGTQSNTTTYYGHADYDNRGDLTLMSFTVGNQIDTISASTAPQGIARYPAGDGGNGSYFFSFDATSDIREYDKAGNQLQDIGAPTGSPRGMDYHEGRDRIYLAPSDGGGIHELERNGNVTDIINSQSGSAVEGLAVNDEDDVFWSLECDGTIAEYDLAGGTYISNFRGPQSTTTCEDGLGWFGQYLVVWDHNGNGAYIVDPEDGSTVSTMSGVPTDGKGGDLELAYGEWMMARRGSNEFERREIEYASSGTHTTSTKSFANPVTPDLQNLVYTLNGESITLDVVGSPGTGSEEVVTQSLGGASSYSLSWSNSHNDFEIRVDFSTATATVTPVVETLELVG